jgi:hypothetical protein
VVNDFVLVAANVQSLIRQESIGKDFAAFLHIEPHFGLDSVLLSVGNNFGTNLPAALQDTDYGSLVFGVSFSNPTTTLVFVHESSRATDKSFVYFYFAARAAGFHGRIGLQRKPDAMQHEPSRLLSDTKGTVNFPRANAILAISDHPHSRKPFVEADSGVLENGPDLHRELALGVASLALPHTSRSDEAHITRAASRAHDASGPAPRHQVVKAVIGIGEVFNRFLECSRLLSHTLILQKAA